MVSNFPPLSTTCVFIHNQLKFLLLSVPGRVPTVSVRGLNASTLQVSWTVAFAPRGIPILHYHIRISTSAEDIAMKTVGSVTQSNTSKLGM